MAKTPAKLWIEYLQHDDPSELIEFYTPFAKSVASMRRNKLPSFVSIEEIEASAMVGLWLAIQRFDQTLGVPFESYARQRINGNILDDLREEDHSSRTTRDLQKLLAKADKSYQEENNRPATSKELAVDLGLTEDEVVKLRVRVQEANVISLDAPIGSSDSGVSAADNIAGGDDYNIIYAQELFQKVINTLTKREQLMFSLLYFEGLTLDQAAPILNLTHPMACQLNFRLSDELERAYRRAII